MDTENFRTGGKILDGRTDEVVCSGYTTKKSKTHHQKTQKKKTPPKTRKHPYNFFALTREKLTQSTKKKNNFPAPFKGAEERGIAALNTNPPKPFHKTVQNLKAPVSAREKTAGLRGVAWWREET